MAEKIAWCLVEDYQGRVLLIQRGFGKEKYLWSLPGGHVDEGEGSKRAAARETREETGFYVRIVTKIMGERNKTWYATIKGGKLKAKKPECLDAKFFSYGSLPKLAFGNDRAAIYHWQAMKRKHRRLASQPLPSACPHCGSGRVRLRRYPHHRNPYRCYNCKRKFW